MRGRSNWVLSGGSKGATTLLHMLLALSSEANGRTILNRVDMATASSPVLSLWRGIEVWSSGLKFASTAIHRLTYALAPIAGQNVDRYDDYKIMAMHPRRFPKLAGVRSTSCGFVLDKLPLPTKRRIPILIHGLPNDVASPVDELQQFHQWLQKHPSFLVVPLYVSSSHQWKHGQLSKDPEYRTYLHAIVKRFGLDGSKGFQKEIDTT